MISSSDKNIQDSNIDKCNMCYKYVSPTDKNCINYECPQFNKK